jgi:hypothetical protein
MHDDDPLPDYAAAPWDTLTAADLEVGAAPPTRTPHAVLLAAHEAQATTVAVLVHLVTTILDVLIDAGLVPPEGRLTPAAFHAARAELQAADAVDAEIGLTGRLRCPHSGSPC